MKVRRHIAAVLLVGSAIAGGPTIARAQDDSTGGTVLAVVQARSGSLTGSRDEGFRLVLRGVSPRATWFTDRPARRTGSYDVSLLLELFFVDQPPPNAALELVEGDGDRDVVIVELSKPRYRQRARRLTFTANVLGDVEHLESTALAEHGSRADQRVPKTFGAATLFLDSACPAPLYLPPDPTQQIAIRDTGRPPYPVSPTLVGGQLTNLNGISCADAQSIVALTDWGSIYPPLTCTNFTPGPSSWGCDYRVTSAPFQQQGGPSFMWLPSTDPADQVPVTTTQPPPPEDSYQATYDLCIAHGMSPAKCQQIAQSAG